ncbi:MULTISPECIES: hypothetical protein [unclassified Microcoleus]
MGWIKIIKNSPTIEQEILKKVPSFVEQIKLAIEQLTDGKKA